MRRMAVFGEVFTADEAMSLGIVDRVVETGEAMGAAEETARRALAIEAIDGWSVHAVVHVMEMQNRYEEGQTFMRSTSDNWAPDNGFAFHNWWHTALYHLDQAKTILALDSDFLYSESDAVRHAREFARGLRQKREISGECLSSRPQCGGRRNRTPEKVASFHDSSGLPNTSTEYRTNFGPAGPDGPVFPRHGRRGMVQRFTATGTA